jgi:hypothetical protein
MVEQAQELWTWAASSILTFLITEPGRFAAIVEQATHLISLSLAFGGKPRLDSVFTHTVEHHEKPGKLSALSFDESTIPENSRVPRYTNSIWKYENGAVGSVIHVIALHKNTYDTVVSPFAH